MLGRNLEDYLSFSGETRSFDESFFDFNDRITRWATVYRFLFLADLDRKTQFMLGIGQKNVSDYQLNDVPTEFSNEAPDYKVGITYWLDNGNLTHKTMNETIKVEDGISSDSFNFKIENGGYKLNLVDLQIDADLDNNNSKTDFIKFKVGVSPFYRHNKYMPFKGDILGKKVKNGMAFIQKVNLNIPFIPWRWGRVFFEKGVGFDFYEPRIMRPLYRSINFEDRERKIEFRYNQSIEFNDSLWTIKGESANGERLKAKIRSYNNVEQVFKTPRSTFSYNEMPSNLEDFEIKNKGRVIHSIDDLGSSVANCEQANYTRINPIKQLMK